MAKQPVSDGVQLTSRTETARTRKSAWVVLAAMGLAALIAQMYSTVVAPALPSMTDDLTLTPTTTAWLTSAYSLAFGASLVAGGRMGELVGEVKIIVIGHVILASGLIVSAISVAAPLMISGRIIQGIGVGICAPATLTIVVNTFPKRRLGFAIGLWGFAHGFGLFVGPLISSWLLDAAGWRWTFWLSLPLAVAVIAVTITATRGYSSVLAKGRYDIPGLIFGVGGIALVTYGLQNASETWSSPATWLTLAVGVILLGIFVFIELKVENPLVDFNLWKSRLFSVGFFAQAAVGFVYIPFLVFIGSLYFINVLGYSPVKASWVIVITTGICMLAEPVGGMWVDKSGARAPITSSLIMQAVALIWVGLFFTPEMAFMELIIPLALIGVGVGIAIPACNTAGMSEIEPKQSGQASGLLQMTFNIPASFGVAVVTFVSGYISRSTPTDGITTSMLALAVVVLIGAVFTYLTLKPRADA